MDAAEDFKREIQTYLEQRAASDELFAVSYAKRWKSIDNCILYILNTMYKSKSKIVFTGEEVCEMGIKYYSEDYINIGEPVKCRITVNHTAEHPENT
jgi:hypothetical protein